MTGDRHVLFLQVWSFWNLMRLKPIAHPIREALGSCYMPTCGLVDFGPVMGTTHEALYLELNPLTFWCCIFGFHSSYFLFPITTSLASYGPRRTLCGDLQLARLLDLLDKRCTTQLGLQGQQLLHEIFSHLNQTFINIINLQLLPHHLL